LKKTKPKRRLRWAGVYAICSGTLTVLVLLALATATCRPGWYAPTAVDRGRLKADKADFANLLDRIGAGLNAGEPVEFELTEAQLNRWLVARGEIWPALRFELKGASGLQISLLDGDAFRLAGVVSNGPLSVVLSGVARCRVEPAALEITVESIRLGKLPVPGGRVLGPLRESIARDQGRTATMTDDTIRLTNRWTWKNGDRPFRLERLEIAAGIARVRLAPLADEP
jgi:hypothetical protein